MSEPRNDATAKAVSEDALATLSAPAVAFALRLSTASVPLLVYMLVLDDMGRGRFVPTITTILGIYSLVVFWGFHQGLNTVLTRTKVRIERKFGPIISSVEVLLGDIQGTNIPHYSGRLVATLRDGRSVVLINKHSVPKAPLPDIDFGGEVPLGYRRTLLRFKHAVDALRVAQQGARASDAR